MGRIYMVDAQEALGFANQSGGRVVQEIGQDGWRDSDSIGSLNSAFTFSHVPISLLAAGHDLGFLLILGRALGVALWHEDVSGTGRPTVSMTMLQSPTPNYALERSVTMMIERTGRPAQRGR
jgi:hypothetical protein